MDKLAKIITTADGSHSLLSNHFQETYHSRHGALQESKHVFLEAGFQYCATPEPSILEIGFGTGLNAFLTYLDAIATQRKTKYTGIELFPVPSDIYRQLNYPLLLKQKAVHFLQLHTCDWECEIQISPYFTLYKKKCDFFTIHEVESYDLIYFDAFAPNIQENLWGDKLLKILFAALRQGGILVTYGAKGSFRRALKSVGFEIEKLPGPSGKREMTRAEKL